MVKRWLNDGRNGGAGAARRAGIAAIGISKTMPVRHLWIGTPASGFCGESKCAVFLFFQMGMLLDLSLAVCLFRKLFVRNAMN